MVWTNEAGKFTVKAYRGVIWCLGTGKTNFQFPWSYLGFPRRGGRQEVSPQNRLEQEPASAGDGDEQEGAELHRIQAHD